MRRPPLLVVLGPLIATCAAAALDKQGSAHGGEVGVDDRGFNVSGTLLAGVAPYNPGYAARPGNTGLTLMRYGAHVDVDLHGRLLSLPLDVSVFSDREVDGLRVLAPSEFDVIRGVTSTFGAGPGDLEVGVRVEHDRPVDRGTFTQTYADVRSRYLFSLARVRPAVGEALGNGDLAGWATLGGFLVNPSYAARPDNTGLALLRYALHGELSILDDRWSFGTDATMFTDRRTNAVRPSELDLTVEGIWHRGAAELHLAYERDMPVDRGGLVQQFVYVLGGWTFDFKREPRPLTDRNPVPSP